ncbi:hypothetical protein V8C42DRAFT_336380 [Trichoderma barbatum]
MEIPRQPRGLGEGPLSTRRTGHACAQCRHRKQRCGGFTNGIKCRPCTTRKVKCSFQEEVMDLHHNPYFRMVSPKSPTASVEQQSVENFRLSPTSGALVSALTALDGAHEQPSTPAARGPDTQSGEREMPKQIESLLTRIAELERRSVVAPKDLNPYNQPPPSHPEPCFRLPLESGHVHREEPPNTLVSPATYHQSNAYSFSSSPGDVITDGPLKTLNRFHEDDPVEFEVLDPIARPILTQGESYVMFKLFFSHAHQHAPFLDVDSDSDPDRVRSSSTLLFLAILSIGARYWSASSRTSCWLHPRYHELVRLLDAEIMRVTLHPRQEDHRLETIQALLLCAHWMPLDKSADGERYQSRFSEAGAWHCLGLAIRWSSSLALEKTCHASFQNPETVTCLSARTFRTMLYLIESDHYLALSARRPSYLNPEPLNKVLSHFIRCPYTQPTDMRLVSLFQVAYGAHFTNCQPTTIESVEAFDRDVQLVERHFALRHGDQSMDTMSQHFPFTSLRWYRLSYTCAFLDSTDQNQRKGKALAWAVDWASQILIHLSKPSSPQEAAEHGIISSRLEPDPSVVDVMSFAIDHYFVVIAYAAFFLLNSWLRNLVDLNLRIDGQQTRTRLNSDPSSSLLFRLVDVAARTLEACSPPEGHLARRYVPLLRGLTDIILSDNLKSQYRNVDTGAATAADNNSILPDQMHANLGEGLWDIWQQAGLEPINWSSLLDDMSEVK